MGVDEGNIVVIVIVIVMGLERYSCSSSLVVIV